jgi:hypothetical protein
MNYDWQWWGQPRRQPTASILHEPTRGIQLKCKIRTVPSAVPVCPARAQEKVYQLLGNFGAAAKAALPASLASLYNTDMFFFLLLCGSYAIGWGRQQIASTAC